MEICRAIDAAGAVLFVITWAGGAMIQAVWLSSLGTRLGVYEVAAGWRVEPLTRPPAIEN
jgi:hypothetical protein